MQPFLIVVNFVVELLYLLFIDFHCLFFWVNEFISDVHVIFNLIDFSLDWFSFLKELNLFAHKFAWLLLELGEHGFRLDHFSNLFSNKLSINQDGFLDFLDLIAQIFLVSLLALDGDDLADEALDLCSLNESLSLFSRVVGFVFLIVHLVQ